MSTPQPTQRLITGYVPALSLSIVALSLFGVLGAVFATRWFRTRSQKWTLSLTIGTICMTIGFAARIPLTNNPGSLIIYIVTTLFTLLSPCAFLAHNYLLLPRLARWLEADDCLFLRPRLIARIFVWMDVTTFLVQACGGGLTAISDQKIADIGTKIALVGLIVQCISFGTFCMLTAVFAFKLRARHPAKWLIQAGLGWKQDWRVVYGCLVWNCILIMVRCVFRVIEFAEGYSGKLRTVEWYIYTFDTLPLFLAITVWAIVWPPSYLRSDNGPASATNGEGQDAIHMRGVEGHLGGEGGHNWRNAPSSDSSQDSFAKPFAR